MIGRELIVFGAGGHGSVVAEAALLSGWRVRSIIDDHPLNDERWGIPIVSSRGVDWRQFESTSFIVAIGDFAVRQRIFEMLRSRGMKPATIVHPSAVISEHSFIGGGTIVAAGAVVNPSVEIGDNCILNTCSSVDHDCRISAHVHICPGVHLAGAVQIGEGSLIGMGTVILPGITIGQRCCIGAGAVVTHHIPAGQVAYGNPAKLIARSGAEVL